MLHFLQLVLLGSCCRPLQEQKAEKLNTFVSLESKVDDVIDSKPLQAESVGVDLRAQEWLQDSVPSRTQHVSQDRFSGLCQKVEVAEAFLSTEFTGAEKVETLETDTGLQEKLLERIAKLETGAAVQAESVAELQAKIEGLVQMERNRYLKDTLCQKQQELEHAVNCVEKKIEHIPTMISDFETRFEQVESDVASQKDHLATLISHSGERFQEVERVSWLTRTSVMLSSLIATPGSGRWRMLTRMALLLWFLSLT